MPKKQSSAPLLSPEERETCAKVAAMKTVLISQRAQVLLLIDEGKTQAETVTKTGLSIGQVRYAVTRFKKVGLSMFPPIPPVKNKPEAPVAKPLKEKKKDKKKKKSSKKPKCKKDKKSSTPSSKNSGKKKKKIKTGKNKKKKQ